MIKPLRARSRRNVADSEDKDADNLKMTRDHERVCLEVSGRESTFTANL